MRFALRSRSDGAKNIAQTLVSHSVKMVTAQVLVKTLSIVAFILIARHVATGTYGVYNTALVLSANWAVLIQFGLRVPLLRAVAREPERTADIVAQVLALRLILALLTAVLALVWGFHSFHNAYGRTLFGWLLLSSMVNNLSITFDEGLQAREQFGASSWCSLVNGTLVNVGMITGALIGRPIAFAVGSQLFAGAFTIVQLACFTARTTHRSPWRLYWSRPLAAELIQLALGAGATLLLGVWGNRTDLLVARHFLPDEQIGWYSVPLRAYDAASALVSAVAATAQPLLSRAYVRLTAAPDDDSVFTLAGRLLRVGFVLSIPFCLLACAVSQPVLNLFGPRYAVGTRAAVALCVLVWVQPWNYFGIIVQHLLFLSGRGWWVALCLAFSIPSSVVASWYLVPRCGIVGAAVGRVVFGVVVSALTIVALAGMTRAHWAKVAVKPFIFGLLVTLAWALCPPWNWALRAPALLVVDLALALALRVWGPEEWHAVRSLLNRHKTEPPAADPPVAPD